MFSRFAVKKRLTLMVPRVCISKRSIHYPKYIPTDSKSLLFCCYRRALAVTPNHSNTLYNYAVLLDTHLKRREDAEGYYRQTITLEPRHAYALYNIAVLLEEQFVKLQNATPISNPTNSNANAPPSSPSRQSQTETEINRRKTEVCDFYRRAAEADPKDGNSLADYGR
jgi:tetratricopeptide (TPR) repeat protein